MYNIAGIDFNDTANAQGISISVYVSGCDFHCKNCHNPEAQDFSYGEPYSPVIAEKIQKGLRANGVKRSLCILGGEPLNPQNIALTFCIISDALMAYPDTPIYIWSGYEMNRIKERALHEPVLMEILKRANYIIDGLYEHDKRDITLRMRGSTNQKVYQKINNEWIWRDDI